MAAAVTLGVTSADTSNGPVGGYVTPSFTPAASDFLFAFVQTGGTTDSAPTMTDSQGLGWDLIGQDQKVAGDYNYMFAARALAANSAMTVTFDTPNDPATGANIIVLRVSGMTKVGYAAVRQWMTIPGQTAATTPTLAFDKAPLTGNAVLGFIGNNQNPAGLTPPATWTEAADIGFLTPTVGAEAAFVNSGFTSATVTWGSTSAGTYGIAIAELDTTATPLRPAAQWRFSRKFVQTTTEKLQLNDATSANAYATPPFTWGIWYKMLADGRTQGSTFMVAVDNTAEFPVQRFQARGDQAGDPIQISQDTGAGNQQAATTTQYSRNCWESAMYITASNTDRRVYKNGVDMGQDVTNASTTGFKQFVLGLNAKSVPTHGMNGLLAYGCVWRSELLAADIAAFAAGTHPSLISPSTLLEIWPVLGASPELGYIGGKNLVVTGSAISTDFPPVDPPPVGFVPPVSATGADQTASILIAALGL